MRYKNLVDMFDHSRHLFGHTMRFFDKDKAKAYRPVPLDRLFYEAENFGIGLDELGVQAGDNVGFFADNCSDWTLADLAVLMNGAVNVPRGTDSTPQEIEYILNHCEARLSIFQTETLWKKTKPFLAGTCVDKVVIMDRSFRSRPEENVYGMSDMIRSGEEQRAQALLRLKEKSASRGSDDLFTIIYTSGTTGNPKGVMLTHGNMLYNIAAVPPLVGLRRQDRALSILPVWHIFERVVDYAIIERGASIYYTNIRDLRNDLLKVRPTFMASAPRLWESIYHGIKSKIEASEELRKMLFNAGYQLRLQFARSVDYLMGNTLRLEPEKEDEALQKGIGSLVTAAGLLVPSQIADMVVFAKIREALGGCLRGTISGGGALPPHVDEFFHTIGIPIYEGYGMTECSPIISVRPVGRVIQGTVGFPPDGTQIKILDNKGRQVPIGELGVVHVKGPQVMKGYYKNPEATHAVLKDGWLNTGDLGFISRNGSLSIRGRVKDTIVLSGGENVEPVPIENLLLENRYVNQVIVIGQDRKTLGALIWPDIEKLNEDGYSVEEGSDLNKNGSLRNLFADIIRRTISAENGFKSFERIGGFRFIPKPMEVGDELTNLYKMKRNVITDKYKALIDSIYG